ncbi:MMPL family transporter [Actinomadura scrupuli]|uniref:MMPL family transporter n=1 Tax=Actinomadura scrupuli TaxID=559629 RepID=UPI003D96457E
MSQGRNVAAAAGAWSARHRWWAIGIWVVFVALSIVIGGAMGTERIGDAESEPGDSGRADRIVQAAGFDRHAGEMVFVHSDTGTVDDPAFRAAINDALAAVRATGQAQNIRSPLGGDGAGAVSKDRHSALVQFDIAGDPDTAGTRVQTLLDAVAGVQKAHPGLRVEEFGDASADEALDKALGDDLNRAKALTLPITLLILLFAFGALVAAVLPVGLAFTAYLAAAGLLGPISHLLHVNDTATEVMLLVGMAVGVDYSLFYLRREREEREAGASRADALRIAAATSGRSVLVSGFTVVVAMAGMFLAGDATFSGIAEATILVVLVAVLGSITVLPALLSLLGDRVGRGRLPWIGRRMHNLGVGRRFWNALLSRVLRRPAVWAILSGGLLVALALPALGMHTALPGAEGLPRKLPIMQTFDRIQHDFPGGADPASIVVTAPDVTTPQMSAALNKLRDLALATGEMRAPFEVEVNPAHTVAVAGIGFVGNGTDAKSEHALLTLRERVIPAAFADVPGAKAYVTGSTAGSHDFNEQMKDAMPYVIGFVLLLAFVLLLTAFRSIVVAISAILLNLLSVAAAYGVLVLVFQHTWAEGLLGFTSNGSIAAFLPLFLFAILFGLSMDYHVFIISRIREGHDRGLRNEDAVRHGITATAGVITSAAAVMVAVFAVFAGLSELSTKQIGVGLSAAVLIDATIVRAVLLPAVMKLLGERNWYLPRWLGWLPQTSHETGPKETPEVPVLAPSSV